jgi:hypothetical protein
MHPPSHAATETADQQRRRRQRTPAKADTVDAEELGPVQQHGEEEGNQ